MKSKLYIISLWVLFIVGPIFLVTFNSCTKENGNGIDSIPITKSKVPQDTAFRNPVWEPDLSDLSILKAPSGYYAFGIEKEFSPGLDFIIPIGKSSNLMNWSLQGQAFDKKPAWWDNNSVTAVSAVFNKGLAKYFLFYTIVDSIGVAYSTNPQGPFTDLGKFIDKNELGSVKSPFVYYSIVNSYLFVASDDGIKGVEIAFNSFSLPVVKGSPFNIAGNAFTSVHIFYKNFKYYFFGTTGQGEEHQISMGSSLNIKGPYSDQNGSDLLSGSGTLLIQGDENVLNPAHVGGVFTDANGADWILYNATDANNKTLATGDDRRPVFMTMLPLDNNMWPTSVINPELGWCSPKFGLVQ
jgi:arabinan endo-1,5-alpha-L-arabinosidase